MAIGEPKFEANQPTRFRQLVEELLSESNLFQSSQQRAWSSGEYDDFVKKLKEEKKEERTKIIEAIEKNELSSYLGERPSDQQSDAANCLVAIYDEMKKPNPDEAFIEQTVAQLKEYL
jgi:hypothetical protein